jgi:hypothetical protein
MARRDRIDMKVDVQSNIPGFLARIRAVQPLALDAAVETMIAAIREAAPVVEGDSPHLPGELKESIEEVARDSGTNTAWVGSRLWWAKFVEFGTLPHIIRPNARIRAREGRLVPGRRMMLLFNERFHSESYHLGAKPTPFILLSKERLRVEIPQRVAALLRSTLGVR